MGAIACRVQNAAAPNDNTFVNTFEVGGKLLSLTDGPFPLELDPKTLEVIGKYNFEDKLTGFSPGLSSSAHPLPLPGSNKMVDFIGTDNLLTGDGDVYMFSVEDKSPKMREKL